MKTSNITRFIFILFASIASLTSIAQSQNKISFKPEKRQKIHVDLKITPSEPGFKAGLTEVENGNSKVKLWVSNAEEIKFSIIIKSESGILWSSNFRNAWYAQIFNFSSLDDGEYTIVVKSSSYTLEKSITISTTNYIRRNMAIQ